MVRTIGFTVLGIVAIAAVVMAWYGPGTFSSPVSTLARPTASKRSSAPGNASSGADSTADEPRAAAAGRQEIPPRSASPDPAHSFHWNTTLASGQSAITEGYEGLSGEFVFSKLTPNLSEDKYGNPLIEVTTENFELDVGGGKEALFDAPLTLKPGVESSTAYPTKEGTYRVYIKATPGSDGQSISLETHGDLEMAPPQPPVPGE